MNRLIFGRDNFSFIIAFAIVALIALGCTCGKNFDLSNIGKKEDNTSRASSSPTSDEPDSSRTEGSKPNASTGTIPSNAELQYLVRETMLDFNDALQQADFTDFYSKICKPWQKQVTPDGMKQMFQTFIDNNVSLSGVRDVDANFSTTNIKKDSGYKILELVGEYPTSPSPTKFELNYLAEGSDWKLSKIKVETMMKLR